MENGNNMSNISEKNTAEYKRRVYKYIRNLMLAVLALGFVTMAVTSLVRSADNMIKQVPVSGTRG
jgi:cell division septal protein FtsQ